MKRNYRWNFAWNVMDGVFFLAGMELIGIFTIIPGFIKLLVERVPYLLPYENRLASLVVVIMHLGWFLPPVFAAPYLETVRRRHPLLKKVGVLLRLPVLMLALAVFFYAESSPLAVLVVMYLCLTVFSSMDGLTLPVWMDFVSRMFPVDRRGILFGVRMGLASLAAIAFLLLGQRVISGWAFPLNYGLLFAIAFLLLAASYLSFWQLRETSFRGKRPRLPYPAYVRQVRRVLKHDRNFRRFLWVSLFNGVAMISTVSLYTMKAIERLGLTQASEIGSLSIYLAVVFMVSRGIFMPLAGIAGDRWGNKAVMLFSIAAGAAANLAVWAADERFAFYLSFFLAGATISAGLIAWLNWITEFSSVEDRLTYIIIRNLVLALTAPLPFLGGVLADKFGHECVFLLAAVLCLISFLLFLFLVREPRHDVRDVFFGPLRRPRG